MGHQFDAEFFGPGHADPPRNQRPRVMDPPMATIAPRLRQLREERDLTQTHLGQLLGLAPASAKVQVARWEAGERTPSLARLWELAAALKVEPFELLQPVAQ